MHYIFSIHNIFSIHPVSCSVYFHCASFTFGLSSVCCLMCVQVLFSKFCRNFVFSLPSLKKGILMCACVCVFRFSQKPNTVGSWHLVGVLLMTHICSVLRVRLFGCGSQETSINLLISLSYFENHYSKHLEVK